MDSPSPPADDALLLRCYVREGSEAAFRALAERHLPLVWSVAKRVVNGDAAMAEDVAQMVLADFARKAPALPPDTVAAAWLHRHTVFTASKAVRSEVRRRAREQISAQTEPGVTDAMNASSDIWTEITPYLDAALNRLPDTDRRAILLRYYEQQTLRETGQAIGITEEAARKRIDRALTKLRAHLNRRGMVPAAAILAALIREKSVAAPPLAAAQRILTGAWHRVEAGTVFSAGSARIPWWRQQKVTGSAAALMFAGILWMLFKDDSRPLTRSPLKVPLTAASVLPVGKATASSSQVTLEATIMTLPEKSVSARMLDYEPGGDDATLYRALLPLAEALEKKIEPAEGDSTAGHPLVVLSGPAKLKHMAEKPLTLKPDPENPFAKPPWNRDPDPRLLSLTLNRAKDVSYAQEWPYDPATGRVTPGDFAGRKVGTELTARVYEPDAIDGLYLTDCEVKHMLKPEWEKWPWRQPIDEGPAKVSKAASAYIQQPQFQTVNLQASLALRLSGNPALAATWLLHREAKGNEETEAVRLFLFLNLKP